jgi:2-polyprenyl-3-methyl-5-hydroxy-6-metoxy-1,4-benzoquinol methylase
MMEPAAGAEARSSVAARVRWNRGAVGQEHSRHEVGSLAWYADLHRHRYGYEHPWLPRLLMGDVAGKRVLEIGVGVGLDAAELIRRGAIYTGIDITENHLQRTAAYLQFEGLRAEDLRLGEITSESWPEPFDVVYSFGVLHHIDHEVEVLRKIHSLLKPCGQLRVGLYANVSFFNTYLLATWLVRNRCRVTFNAWQAIVADASDPEVLLTIKVRSAHAITRLYCAEGFKVRSYAKAGFAQNNLPIIGKHLDPDGFTLSTFGRVLGWYHLFCFEKQ